jgi:hypothetical protein
MAPPNRTTTLLAKALLVALLAFGMDRALGSSLRRMYFGMHGGKSYRVTYALEKTSQRMLVFGSSRAYVHYVPAVLEARTGLDCYNAGHDAAGMLYHTALLQGILSRYRPQRLILDFRPHELAEDALGRQMLSVLLPYYRDHPTMRKVLRLRSPAERLKLFSKIYPFNSQLLTILLANRIQWFDDRGFVPLSGNWSLPAQPLPAGPKLDPTYVAFFRGFLALAERNGIALTVVVSPVDRLMKEGSASIRKAEEICREQGVPFLDFSQDVRFLDQSGFFHDPDHLNAGGAELFTKILAEALGPLSSPPPGK